MSSADNVRVVARFRPANKLEKQMGSDESKIVINIVDDHEVVISRPTKNQTEKKFILDHIYPPDSEQETVYEHSGQPLVSEILKGYNATMFAYGQTGSGKTWSMMGEPEDDHQQGLIPRMVNAVFDEIDQADNNLEFVVQVSYIELYNEKIRDLLEPQSTSLSIREHPTKGIYIEGVKQSCVVSFEEVLWHLQFGTQNRATSATLMNAVSSRSHAVFVFRLIAKDKVTGSKTMAKLMMVDLAGSEKLKKTQAQGQRLEEARGINKSLSTLGRVILGLTTGKMHIAYRDSKLTFLLSDSLGGNSKTCIIVTCSPCAYNSDETISTLRFGVNCKKVKNKPKVNKERSIAEYKVLLKKAKEKEEELLGKNQVLRCKVEALSRALEKAGGSVEDAIDEAKREHRELFKQEDNKVHDGYIERFSDYSDGDSPNERTSSRRRSKNPDVVFHTSGGDGAEELLKEQVTELEDLLARVKEERNRYKDDAKNFSLELVETERTVQELIGEREFIAKQQKHAEDTVKKMAGQIGEYRLYKTKLNFMMNDHQIQIERKDHEIERIKQDLEDLIAQVEEEERKGDGQRADGCTSSEDRRRALRAMADIDTKSSSMSVRGDRDMRMERWAAMLDEKSVLKDELKNTSKENKRYKKQIQMMEQRGRYNDALRKNWNNQLAQMEQAVLLANQIHNRDRQQFQLELEDHTEENIRLKKFLMVLSKKQNSIRGNIARPVRSGNSAGKSKQSMINRGKRQSIHFRSTSRPQESSGRSYETPGGDDGGDYEPRYAPKNRSPRREDSQMHSSREHRDSYSSRQEDDRYMDRETRGYLE